MADSGRFPVSDSRIVFKSATPSDALRATPSGFDGRPEGSMTTTEVDPKVDIDTASIFSYRRTIHSKPESSLKIFTSEIKGHPACESKSDSASVLDSDSDSDFETFNFKRLAAEMEIDRVRLKTLLEKYCPLGVSKDVGVDSKLLGELVDFFESVDTVFKMDRLVFCDRLMTKSRALAIRDRIWSGSNSDFFEESPDFVLSEELGPLRELRSKHFSVQCLNFANELRFDFELFHTYDRIFQLTQAQSDSKVHSFFDMAFVYEHLMDYYFHEKKMKAIMNWCNLSPFSLLRREATLATSGFKHAILFINRLYPIDVVSMRVVRYMRFAAETNNTDLICSFMLMEENFVPSFFAMHADAVIRHVIAHSNTKILDKLFYRDRYGMLRRFRDSTNPVYKRHPVYVRHHGYGF